MALPIGSGIVSAIRSTMHLLRHEESGSIVHVAAFIPLLIAGAAVGVETGQLYDTKRMMDNASDGAALAASVDRLAGKSISTITSTAVYEAQRNGFKNGVGSVSVTVNSPPTSGPNVSTPGAVEVVITKSINLSFARALQKILGMDATSITMRSRSVAAQGSYTSTTTSPEGCMVALTPNKEQGVSFSSFNNFNSDCTIISNGTATGSGANASINMNSFNTAALKSIWTRGSFSVTSYNKISLANSAQQNQTTSITDPYSNLPTPTPGGCTYTNFNPSGSGNITLSPGTYCGGLKVSAYNNVYFSPGLYYVANGDLNISSVNNVSCPNCTAGAGVTLILTSTTGKSTDVGGVTFSSLNNLSLNAPVPCSVPSPPAKCMANPLYPGVLIYQDRTATVGTMTSSSKAFIIDSLNNATMTGALYFPNNRIELLSFNNTSASSTGCTVWIGRYIKFSSYNNNHIAGCDAVGTGRPAIITTATTNKSKVIE